MRIPANYFDAANAILGVKDAVSLSSAVQRYTPHGTHNICASLLEKLKAKNLLAFVGNPPVTFISNAAARQVIPEHFAPKRTTTGEQGTAPQSDGIRQEVERLRADLLDEIAKLREGVNELRHDLELMRGAQIKDKTELEQSIGTLVSSVKTTNGFLEKIV